MRTPKLRRAVGAMAALGVIIVAFLIFQSVPTSPTPLFRPLPTPNGYDDFLKAGQLLAGPQNELSNTNAETLRPLVEQNRTALGLVRAGLGRECQVPLEFSTNFLASHMNVLGDFKHLARLLVAEGVLAEADRNLGDAARTYLDLIRFGRAIAQGGLAIDTLVAEAIQALGVKNFCQISGRLNPAEISGVIEALEEIDRRSETFEQILLREQAYFRKTYGWWYATAPRVLTRIASLRTGVDQTRQTEQTVERTFLRRKARLRLLIVHLALQSYKAELACYPNKLSELIPKYLRALPKDPFGGEDLVYSPDSVAYRLYSLGPDLKDDGGKPASTRTSAPRKAGEIPQGDIILD
ncbi:MAG: hypothetical protein HY735_30185 [Verrucomicrobia bacterium]|nr:hypothetical protein [Verrucomicrobiota bacterium]